MFNRLYVKKGILILFSLSFLAVSLFLPCFAEPLTDTASFPIYQYFVSSGEFSYNVYSVTRVSNTDNSLLVSGVNSVADGSYKLMLSTLTLREMGLVSSVTYNFSCRISAVSGYSDFTVDNFTIAFYDSNNYLIHESPSRSAWGTLEFTYTIPDNASFLVFAITGRIPSAQNRFRCQLSPLVVSPINSADIGGSFEGDMPDIPEIDLDNTISDFEGASSDVLNDLPSAWSLVSVPVQHFSLFFTHCLNIVNSASPVLTTCMYLLLTFGSLSMILNIYGFAKSQGSDNSRSVKHNKHKGGDNSRG